MEEQFYLLFPIFVVSIWKLDQRLLFPIMAFCLLISLGLADWASRSSPIAAFYLLPTRGWELLIGAVAAAPLLSTSLVVRIGTRIAAALSFLGLVLIVYAIATFDDKTLIPGIKMLFPTIGTVLVILFAKQGSMTFTILSNKLFTSIGLISYGIYLFHQPLFSFARHRNLLEPSGLLMLSLCALTIPLAYLSWRYVERPFLQSSRVNSNRLVSMVGFCSLIVVCAGFAGRYYAEQIRLRSPEISQLLSHKAVLADKHPCAFTLVPTEAVLARCFKPGKTVFLIGDSHAASISIALRTQLAQSGYSLISLTQNACSMVKGVSRRTQNTEKKSQCRRMAAEATDFISRYPGPVVMSVRWRLYLTGKRYDNGEGGVERGSMINVEFEQSGKRSLEQYISAQLSEIAAKTPLILVDQIPEAGWNVPDTLAKSKKYGSSKLFSTSYARYLTANEPVDRMLSTVKGDVSVVNTSKLVCNVKSNRCSVQVNGLPLYRDDDHPSESFAHMISEAILKNIPTKIVY